jgi:hypothetical protein
MSELALEAPQIHVTDGAEKKIEITFTPHGPVVNVTGVLVKAAVAALGVWVASQGGDHDWLMKAAGSSIVAASGWGIWDHLMGSNDATKALSQKGATS